MSSFPLSKSVASSSASSAGKGSAWRYDAGDSQPLVIRAEPDVDGQRTKETLAPGSLFDVLEERLGIDGVLYLRLSDGRGWAFDRKPGVGTMCERFAQGAEADNFWRYDAGDGQSLVVRTVPLIDGPKSDVVLQPGEVFCVSQEKAGADGVLFLELADGRGWAFDQKPGVGKMCERHKAAKGNADVPPSPFWRYIAKDGLPIFVRSEPDIDGPKTQVTLQPGELFCVTEEKRGPKDVMYLALADGSGWLFDSKPGFGVMCQRHEAPVTLHIYDVPTHPTGRRVNGVFRALGTGAFHAGVEVYGVEWSFGGNQEGDGGTGVFTCQPRGCEGHAYRESIHMGHTPMEEERVRAMIGRISKEWLASDYNILRANCCHFSDLLCQKLQVGAIPSWVRNLSGAVRVLEDRRADLAKAAFHAKEAAREVVGPIVAPAVDPIVARGKIARGGKPEDAFQMGDFTLGLVSTVAEQGAAAGRGIGEFM
eukprot:CAMPEP_0198513768 /NCGR_PEP_ID=MMETSP1462-20131121/16266_1 /TAXON_ID=1333877 /ORGANISM="Brandtodinium nutriculum, Strain RCC3387" /LENGTH=478 /DNA_ID=CAMNT_0044243193 /DNA_START=21 /DNA_END=1454 /DNA_ORIENTATION=-